MGYNDKNGLYHVFLENIMFYFVKLRLYVFFCFK